MGRHTSPDGLERASIGAEPWGRVVAPGPPRRAVPGLPRAAQRQVPVRHTTQPPVSVSTVAARLVVAWSKETYDGLARAWHEIKGWVA